MAPALSAQGKRGYRNLRDSRDEMNLCEVPFAALSERTSASVVTFRFTDYDRELGQVVQRSYRIAGHVEYGLPTAKDEDIYLGCLKLSHDYNRFQNPLVHFSRSELFDILNWRKSDWAYDRLELGLHRLSGVRITCKNSWRDNRNKEWRDNEDFGILDSFKLRDMRIADSSRAFEEYSSQFIWGSVLFDSFDASFLKKLDLSVVRKLRSSAAKKLYRFLDKRFHAPKRTQIEMPVRLLAYERIGVSRKTPVDKVIKRHLQPAAEELEQVGFLEPISHKKRFVKLKGEWHVTFRMKSKQSSGDTPNEAAWHTPNETESRRLVAALVKRDVPQKVAARHVEQHPKETVLNAVKAFDEQSNRVECSTRWFSAALRGGFEPNSARQTGRVLRPEHRIFRAGQFHEPKR